MIWSALKPFRLTGAVLIMTACSLFLTSCVRYKSKALDPVRLQARFEIRNLDDAGISSFAKSFGAGVAWPPKTLDLTTATLIAAYYSPDLALARARLDTAAAAVITAGGRPNPEATGAGGYETAPASPVIIRFELSLPIETAGKRHYRILEAQEQLEVARTDLRAAAWNVYAKVRDSWFEYTAARRAQMLAQEELTLRNEIVTLFQQRLAVGEVASSEVNGVRIIASQAASAYAEASGRADAALSQLATSLGIPSAAIANLPAEDTHFIEPPPLDALPTAAVQERGLLNRLDVRRVQVEYAAADAHLHLALAQQYPDIRLNPGYDFEEGFHKFTFGPTIPLPVWNRNRGPIAEADASRNEVQARFEATQEKAIGEVERSTALYRAALLKTHEAEQKLNRLQQSQERLTNRAVQVGEHDRLTLLQAQLETNAVERARAVTLSDTLAAFAKLEDAVQAPLSGISILPIVQPNPLGQGVHP